MPFPTTHPALARALAAHDYAEPTPVQDAVLQPHTAGRDLLVSAQTGSGKTVAYGLAFADTLLDGAEFLPRAGAPLALVIAPTRELALQVHGELSWLYAEAGARVAACVGGMDARREARMLASGCHIVVGTPGRLGDHMRRGQLDLSALRVVVLDEADEMLDMGFREELHAILDATPAERRTLLFSATIPREIAALARSYQRDALRIDTVARNVPHNDIEYRAIRVAPADAARAVVNVLRLYESRAAIVFCHTRDAVRSMHAFLLERGFAAVLLSGELSQHDRTQALQALRDGRASVCVATDVAARGLDLPDLALVVHADLPGSRDTLLHRSGRTGRAGRKGVSVVIVPHPKRRRAEQLFAAAGIAAQWGNPPTAAEIRARDAERMAEDPVLAREPDEAELAEARILLESRTPEQIAAALVRLYRARLPAVEESFAAEPEPRHPQPNRRDGAREGATVWFRMNVGRQKNADPKWILPAICRIGGISRADIGAIRIFDKETKFEISRSAAPAFEAAVREADGTEFRIQPAGADRPARKDHSGPRPFKTPWLRDAKRAAPRP